MITLIVVANPLMPYLGSTRHPREFIAGKTLSAYLAELNVTNAAISVNGHIQPPELLDNIFPCDGDTIVIAPKVAGGSLIKTLGSLAVLAVATVVSGGLATGPLAALGAGALGSAFSAIGLGGVSALGASLIAAGVAIGGNLLISALTSKPPSSGSSPTYAFGGPQMGAQSGTVIPKGYGTIRWGGNCIASFVDIDSGNDQYLNVLVCFGFGPARALTNIQINGKDINTYRNVQYYTRLGTNGQTPIPNFNRVVNGYPQDTECLAGDPVIVPGTGTLTQIGQVDIQFPNGLFVLTSDGNYIPLVITYKVEFAASGTGAWQSLLVPRTTENLVTYSTLTGLPDSYPSWVAMATDLPPGSGVVYTHDNGPHTPGDPWSATVVVDLFQADGSYSTYNKVCYGEWQPTDPAINLVQVDTWSEGYINFSGCQTTPMYNRTTLYYPTPGKWDIRVTKYGSERLGDGGHIYEEDWISPNVGEQMWLHSVNEIAVINLAYPNMILVGIRALATSQLGGANLNVTALVQHGLRSKDTNLLPAALQAYEEDNPACVAADMMIDGLYGGGQWPGILPTNIDRFSDEWIAWAENCDTLVPDGNGNSIRMCVFNGVFDNNSNLWESVQTVARMSRAAVIPIGKDYGVFVDKPDVPVQIFTMGNIVSDSFQETWLELDARANQVEIEFADSTRFYKQDNPIVYMDPANQDAGVAIKNVRVDGRGITIPAQAWHHARFKERQNEFCLRTGSFRTDTDGIAARVGNLIILQHDVPQWGWGGRTLPESTASVVYLDRSDLAFVAGTGYSLIVLHPSLVRYAGSVTASAVLTDASGLVNGTQLTLSSFDNVNRVTRCQLTDSAGRVWDNPVKSASAGSVLILPVAGCTPAGGQAYQLFDTDVMETRAVSNLIPGEGDNAMPSVLLQTPLSVAPQDFSTYFYGVTGSQKLVRITNIKGASDFRATIEWLDYDAGVYTVATPVIGETSAQSSSHPQVTSLTVSETFQLLGGSYISYANLAWKNGPDTVGVGIYALATGANAPLNQTPQLIARLSNAATGFQLQVYPGVTWQYTVVGFDTNGVYASITAAPTVTLTVVGVATNLLLGSNFASGFTYWNLTPRAGDTLAWDNGNDGEATYTLAGSPITAPTAFFFQSVPASKWAVGDYLMLSAYVQDTCASPSVPNAGNLTATLVFVDGAGTQTYARAVHLMGGTSPVLPDRVWTPATQIPTGTAQILVWLGVDAAGLTPPLSVPPGSVLSSSHYLLEICPSTQTVPSAWADIDIAGHILDLFTSGTSTGLRTQGSVLPSFTGDFSIAGTDTTGTPAWTGLVILWPDGEYQYVQDGSIAITGLNPSTKYYAYPYFDILNGGVHFIAPASAFGSPALLSVAYDAVADAATRQDNRVPLAAGGLTFVTYASGGAGTVTGGGGTGTGGSGGGPINGPERPLEPL